MPQEHEKVLKQIILIAMYCQSQLAIDTFYPCVIDTTLQSCFEEWELQLIHEPYSSLLH